MLRAAVMDWFSFSLCLRLRKARRHVSEGFPHMQVGWTRHDRGPNWMEQALEVAPDALELVRQAYQSAEQANLGLPAPGRRPNPGRNPTQSC